MKGLRGKVRHLLEEVQNEQKRETEKDLTDSEIWGFVFTVGEPRAGFGGKVVMTAKTCADLTGHRVMQGSVLTLRSQCRTQLRGIVLEVRAGEMAVAFENATQALRAPDASWMLVKMANSIVFRRMTLALQDMQRLTSGRVHDQPLQIWVGNKSLVPTLLAPRSTGIRYMSGVQFLDKNLNVSQKKTVSHALGASCAALIHGPPGTGKTRVLVELIRQEVLRGERVLVCASSNVVVDRVMKEACDKGVDCLRLGNPNSPKVLQETKHCYFEHRIVGSEEDIEIERAEKEMERLLAGALVPSFDDWDGFSKTTEEIRARLFGLKERAAARVMAHATAVFCTLSTAGGSLIAGQCFDVLIIDGAAQALEPECWIAIAHCKKVVLAGDIQQLPPAVHEESSPLALSLFERLLSHFAAPSLNIQYRMHQSIVRFPASQHYTSLATHVLVKDHLLSQLPGVASTSVTTCPLMFINTSGHHLEEEHREQSIPDEEEAAAVMAHVGILVAANVSPKEIIVIVSQDSQVKPMKRMAASKYPQLTISTIDGALGQEREAVVLSLVCSNPENDARWLYDYRRLNVAITRARRHLCVIGDASALTTHSPFVPGFLSDFIHHLLVHARVCNPGFIM